MDWLIRMYATRALRRFRRWEDEAASLQEIQFARLMDAGRLTSFGRAHGFDRIKTHEEFINQVPVRDYEGFAAYMEAITKGEKNVLWPGSPMYFAKTSGTTSGTKYIPITRESMPNQVDGARNAMLMYILKTGRSRFLKGKYIFLSGSPELEKHGEILAGRLSGIAHRHVPAYLRHRRLPSYHINCMGDWEEKLEQIITETLRYRMSLISGIPPWLEMYFERLLEVTGKQTVLEVFPHFSLMMHGGVLFEHYKGKLFQLIGKEIDHLETFPASEGFFAFQDEFPSQGLLLIPDSGIFYEFIPANRYHEANPPRLRLSEVECGVHYAMIITTNAGLWAYSLGDTVRFVSRNPYRLVVSGRLKQYTSAFGEHVIEEETTWAIERAAADFGALIKEYTLAPLVHNPDGKACHQWFIEFKSPPAEMDAFARCLDEALQHKNAYYRDLVQGGILQQAMVIPLPPGSFRKYMKAVGKLGGQNKIPHLSNDRNIADWLLINILQK